VCEREISPLPEMKLLIAFQILGILAVLGEFLMKTDVWTSAGAKFLSAIAAFVARGECGAAHGSNARARRGGVEPAARGVTTAQELVSRRLTSARIQPLCDRLQVAKFAVISITCSRFTVAPTCSAHVKRTELSRVIMTQLRNALNLKVLLA
jgi:hypothetical protein